MNLDVFYKSNSAHFGRKPLFEGDIKRKGTNALSKKQEEKSLDKYLKEKQTIQHQFDRFAKMVLAGEANKQKKEYARRSLYEATFSDLSPQDTAQLYAMDEYPSDNYHFCVERQEVIVKDDLIGRALAATTKGGL